jgi:hypothetical protein
MEIITDFTTISIQLGYAIVFLMSIIIIVAVISYREMRKINKEVNYFKRKDLLKIRKKHKNNELIREIVKNSAGFIIPEKALVYDSVKFCQAYMRDKIDIDKTEGIYYGTRNKMTDYKIVLNGYESVYHILKFPKTIVIPKN